MKKQYLLMLFFFVGTGILVLIFEPDLPGRTKPASTSIIEEESASAVMSFKNIDLTQGDKGLEQWNLKADDAEMEQEGGLITAQNPVLTYYMSADKKNILIVRAVLGEVEQGKNQARFEKNVVVSQDSDNLYTDLILYEGESERLLCPDGGEFSGRAMHGKAGKMIWLLKSNTLHAEQGVSVEWKTASSVKPGGLYKSSE